MAETLYPNGTMGRLNVHNGDSRVLLYGKVGFCRLEPNAPLEVIDGYSTVGGSKKIKTKCEVETSNGSKEMHIWMRARLFVNQIPALPIVPRFNKWSECKVTVVKFVSNEGREVKDKGEIEVYEIY